MGKTLTEIAQQLRDGKPIQLIYAFNGSGKTRLSREFRLLVDPKANGAGEPSGNNGVKVIYFNAFTEDLFYWDNDLNGDVERKLKIQSNSFTDWVLAEQGQEPRIIAHFQRYTHDKLTPRFNQQYVVRDDQKRDKVVKAYSEVTFSVERGDDTSLSNIKPSKGEESNFIWCIFYSLLEQVVEVLNVVDPDERETERFNQLQYVFIDDPVSSLDDNHLIELAVNLAQLIKKRPPNLKFIITTHSALFYNVLHNELNLKEKGKKEGCFLLNKNEDGSFDLENKIGDSNRSFSYHLHLKGILERAIAENRIEKFHFTLLRNLYEKTAAFLGYQEWSALLPGERDLYYNRIIQFASHSTLAHEVVPEPTEPEKQTIRFLLDHLSANYRYRQQEVATRD